MSIKKVTAKGSQLAEALLSFKGNRVQFGRMYEPQRLLYDLYPQSLTIKAGRQVGKSLGLAGRIVTGSIAQKYFTSLFIAPSQIQTKRWSSGYLDTFRESPYVAKHFIKHSDPSNVFEKTFTNKSKVYLSYGQTSADMDRVRGLTADLLCLDEVQDIQLTSIPVVKEILNTSDWGYTMYTGTSKSTAGTLESLWLDSNQMEFCQKCHKCGKWVIPNNSSLMREMMVNPDHLVCPYCHKKFSFFGGQWVATRNEMSKGPGAKFGLHMPQMVFGANNKPRQWADMYDKVQSSLTGSLYTPELIDNEVFGLATDLGSTSLSIREVQACCLPDYTEWAKPDKSNVAPSVLPLINQIHSTVLGVDWSVSGSVGSHTVITVLGVDHSGRMTLLFAKKLVSGSILEQVDEVLATARAYNCKMIGSDRGVGVLQGELMQQQYGATKVIMCNYVSASRRLRWDSAGNFLAADRTGAMDDMMHKIRLGPDRFISPKWAFTEGLWGDALSIFEEETTIGKRVYRKQPSIPDDFFHSLVFANLAYKYLTGEHRHLDSYSGQD